MKTAVSSEDETLALWPVLKLTQKYQCDSLQIGLTSSIRKEWPESLVEWEAQESQISVYASRLWTEEYEDRMLVDDEFPEPASAIRLGRDFDIPEILPAAFYHISRIDTEMEWDRARSCSGEISDRATCHFEDQLNTGERTARWGLLSHTDLLHLMRGKARLEHIACYSDIFDKLFDREDGICTSSLTCRGAREAAKKAMVKKVRGRTPKDGPLDLLKTIRLVRVDYSELEVLCTMCRCKLVEESQTICETLWELLPDLFFKEEYMYLNDYPFESSSNES